MVRIHAIGGSVAVAILVAGCGGGDPDASKPVRSASTATAATTSPAADALPESLAMQDVRRALDIDAMPRADWITVAGGIAWVANVDNGIVRFRRDGHRLGVVPTPTDVCAAMDQGFGSVWAVACIGKQLVRMDARTGALQARIALEGVVPAQESSVAVGPEGVFLIDGEHAIARVDPETNLVDPTRLGGLNFPSALRLAYGSLWVTCAGTGVVTRLDPATGSVQAEITTKPGIRFVTAGQDAIWVLNNDDGDVYRIDPASNTVAATIDVGDPVNGGDIAFGHDSVWARVTDSLVAQIDPDTNAVVKRYGEPSGSGSVAADDTALWISAHDKLTVWRVLLD
jgi:virginiamycin B lyase